MLMPNYVLVDMLRHMLVMRCKLLFLLFVLQAFYEMKWKLIDCYCGCFVFFTHLRNV